MERPTLGRAFPWLKLIGVLIVAAGRSTSGAEPGPAASTPNEALTSINVEFRASYARARAERLARSGPVLLFDGEKLLLLRGDERRVGTPVGPAYHHLKT